MTALPGPHFNCGLPPWAYACLGVRACNSAADYAERRFDIEAGKRASAAFVPNECAESQADWDRRLAGKRDPDLVSAQPI